MSDHEYEVLDAMQPHGGSFASSLAIAWKKADHDNFKRLRLAFPDYWERYEAIAQTKKPAEERK
jgi:hypothetical protein